MKMLKNLIAGSILGMVFLSSAANAMAITPRYNVYPCPSCEIGDVITSKTRVFEHEERFPCVHGTHNWDVYDVYEVTESEQCDTCSYGYSRSYEEHVYKYCTY